MSCLDVLPLKPEYPFFCSPSPQAVVSIHESFISYTFLILSNKNILLPKEFTYIYFSNSQPEMNYLLFIDIKSGSELVWEYLEEVKVRERMRGGY